MDVSYLDDEDETVTIEDPIDMAEAVLGGDSRFATERSDSGDLSFNFKAAWCDVTGFIGWRSELPAVLLTVAFDLNAPPERMTSAGPNRRVTRRSSWIGLAPLAHDGS